MTIGDKIKQARTEKGLTQDELAKKLGYKSRSSINKIETGGRDIPRSQIKKIAAALGVSPVSLLGLDEDIDPYKMPTSKKGTVIEAEIKEKSPPHGTKDFFKELFSDLTESEVDDLTKYVRFLRYLRTHSED